MLLFLPDITSVEKINAKSVNKTLSSSTWKNPTTPSYHQGTAVVKFKDGAGNFERQSGKISFGIPSLDGLATEFGIDLLEKRFRFDPLKRKEGMPDLSRIYRIEFPESLPVNEVTDAFNRNPMVEYAEAIPVNTLSELPDDEMLAQCQHLPQIMAPEAWEVHHGEDGEEVVVAIVDTGTDWLHPDLVENTWQNLGEDADGDGATLQFNGSVWERDPDDLNGIDDDGNGYVDDVIGWDFYEDTWSGDGSNPDPLWNQGAYWHGTHCSGIAAGRTNNGTGIASVSWNVKYMPLQTANTNGGIAFGYDGIIYAAENGADIISNSWGGSLYSQANAEAVEYAQQQGSIVVGGAANYDNEVLIYPASYQGVISVASVNGDDTKADYSNYNPAVDISAPGGGSEGGILSTFPVNQYVLASGTSMAGPLVAGCMGLLKSYRPDWTNEQLITQLLGTAEEINSINPGYEYLLGSGRVNAYHLLTDENVTMPQEFKLVMTGAIPADENGNDINEPGELVTLDFEFWNYIPYLEEEDVTVTLVCNDPAVEIIDGSAVVDIPPEGSFAIVDQFTIKVSEDATSQIVPISVHFQSNIPVVCGQDTEYPLLVAPSGIFVLERESNTPDYSGRFIRTFLEKLGYEVTHSSEYPYSLKGFETVFASHGNPGQYWNSSYRFTEQHALLFQDFLELGGNIYAETNPMFRLSYLQGYSNQLQLRDLFGVTSNSAPNNENPVDSLFGNEQGPFEGIFFNESGQHVNWRIEEVVVPAASASTPFKEYPNSNVSVMNDGTSTFGHKTFYFSYALAALVDNSATNSRYNVLLKIMEFFGHELPDGYVLSNFMADKTAGGPPLEVQFTDISLSDTGYPVNSWMWDFDSDGTIDSYEQNPVHTFTAGGTHDVMLIVSNGVSTDTMMMEDLIRVNHGFLIYEGVEGGPNYSGSFISDYLSENAYTHTYTAEFPEDLQGYAAVFLSLGNYGLDYTEFNSVMANTVIEYLESGGYLYLEGGDALGWDQASNTQLLQLMGLASAQDGTTNVIDSLYGQPDALTYDLYFTGSNQLTNTFIDIYAPLDDAEAALVESDYGIVAVQNTGSYDQRTFCFSYSLGDLQDGEYPNTREELLQRICNFFDIYTNLREDHNMGQLTIFPNPCEHDAIISFSLKEPSPVLISVVTIEGRTVRTVSFKDMGQGNHMKRIDFTTLPSGIYLLMFRTNAEMRTQKIIKLN